MANKIFFLDILDDFPIIVSIFMSIYPQYRNDNIFFVSLFIGIMSYLILFRFLRKASIEEFISSLSFFDMLGYVVYIFFLFGFLIYLTITGKLYMKWVVWAYVLFIFIMSMYSIKKRSII